MIENKIVSALICECNPFHEGHKKIINYIKNSLKSDYIVAIMSGDFVQRGEPAVIDKYERANILIENGVDLVIEIPVEMVLSSAKYFATASMAIIKKLKFVDNVVFGSNINDINKLKEISNKDIDKKTYHNKLKLGMTHSKILSEICNIKLSPNDILGVEYIKAKKDLNLNVNMICIKRDENMKSATQIREHMNLKITLNSFSDYLNQILFFNKKNNIPLNSYYSVNENLMHSIEKDSTKNLSFDSRIDLLNKKNRTVASIKRALLHILLNIKENDVKKIEYGEKIKYLNILNIKPSSKNILKYIKCKYIFGFTKKELKKIFSDKKVDKSTLTNIYATDLYESIYKK